VSCGSGSLWLPLKWGKAPAGTSELAVFIGRYEYEQTNDGRKLQVPFGDLISGISPALRGNAANAIPEGVFWSRFGKISCPPARRNQHIILELFALDRRQEGRELDRPVATRLTAEALRADGEAQSSRAPGELTREAVGIGHFLAVYAP